eukprot:10782916-Lingulodinium_polyedra.AAC.1
MGFWPLMRRICTTLHALLFEIEDCCAVDCQESLFRQRCDDSDLQKPGVLTFGRQNLRDTMHVMKSR